jgi:NADH:ubiquinone oxidoreductase subunit E
MVKGSKRTVYVTRAEMDAYEKANTPEYKFEANTCDCHPETCGCNPFKIVDREGNKITTAFNEDQAKKVVEILNK